MKTIIATLATSILALAVCGSAVSVFTATMGQVSKLLVAGH